MWQYNFDYLCHSSHKYIDKTYKNGRWQYTYPQDLKGYRDTSNKKPLGIPSIGYKRQLLSLKRNTQNAKDRAYATRSKMNKTAEKASKQAEEERRQVGTNQNTTDISKASKNPTPQPSKSNLSSRQQTAVNKAVAKSIAYINKTYGTNYGSEVATAAEKERVKRAVEASKDRPAKDQNSREAAIARSVEATKNATQLANARKQEAERRRASNTAERSQNAREDAIAKSITSSKQIANAKKQEYERMVAGSTRRENTLRDDPYISSLLNKELKGNLMRDVVDYLDAYEKVYDKVKDDPKVTAATKDDLKVIINAFKEEVRKRSGTGIGLQGR